MSLPDDTGPDASIARNRQGAAAAQPASLIIGRWPSGASAGGRSWADLGFALGGYAVIKAGNAAVHRYFPAAASFMVPQATWVQGPDKLLGELVGGFAVTFASLGVSTHADHLLRRGGGHPLRDAAVPRPAHRPEGGLTARPRPAHRQDAGDVRATAVWTVAVIALATLPGAGLITLAVFSEGAGSAALAVLRQRRGDAGRAGGDRLVDLRFFLTSQLVAVEDLPLWRLFVRSGQLTSGRVGPGLGGLVKARLTVLLTVMGMVILIVSLVGNIPALGLQVAYAPSLVRLDPALVPVGLLVPAELVGRRLHLGGGAALRGVPDAGVPGHAGAARRARPEAEAVGAGRGAQGRMSALLALWLLAGCPSEAVAHVPEAKREGACAVLARDAPAPVNRAALDAIYREPELSRARIRNSGALEAMLARLEAWLDRLAGSRGVETYSVVTRWLVMGLGALAALWAIARLLERRRGPAAVKPAAPGAALVLEDPQLHFGRAERSARLLPARGAAGGAARAALFARARAARPPRPGEDEPRAGAGAARPWRERRAGPGGGGRARVVRRHVLLAERGAGGAGEALPRRRAAALGAGGGARVRRLWPLGLLLWVALALGLVAGQGSRADSPLCSKDNPGPQGAAVLDRWLKTSGAKTFALPAPLTTTAGLGSVVILGAAQRRFGHPEVALLEAFVRQGGTLVYLPPPRESAQSDLDRWLQLYRGESWPDPDRRKDDPGGRDLAVTFPHGLLAGAQTLRLSAEPSWASDLPGAIDAAGDAVWVIPLGEGEVWVAPGPSLAENRRLDLADNAVFWANLARRGAVGFTEGHLVAPDTSQARRHLWGVTLELLFVGAVGVLASLRRLGPARPRLERSARSSLEYVRALANLARRAHVEGELFEQMRQRVRRVMHEQAGIAPGLPADEAARALEAAGVPLGEALLRLARADAAAVAGDPAQFSSLGRDAAQIERRLLGRM